MQNGRGGGVITLSCLSKMFPHLAGRHQSVFCTDKCYLDGLWLHILALRLTLWEVGTSIFIWTEGRDACGLSILYLDLIWLTEQILIELEILWVESEIFIRQHVTHASFFSAAPIFGHRCRGAVLRQNTWPAKHTWHTYSQHTLTKHSCIEDIRVLPPVLSKHSFALLSKLVADMCFHLALPKHMAWILPSWILHIWRLRCKSIWFVRMWTHVQRFNPGSSTKYLVRQIFRIHFCWRHIWAQAVGSGWLAFP